MLNIILIGIVMFLPSLLMLLAGDTQWATTLFVMALLAFFYPPLFIMPLVTLLIFVKHPD